MLQVIIKKNVFRSNEKYEYGVLNEIMVFYEFMMCSFCVWSNVI